MSHFSFICHASKDRELAMKIVSHLEQEGISCWIAPRDIPLGSNYQAAIIQGIKKSSVVIFLFTQSSNESEPVVFEIEKANAQKILIIPFKVHDLEYADALEYFLRSKQAIMAYEAGIEKALAMLVFHIKKQLAISGQTEPVSEQVKDSTTAKLVISPQKKTGRQGKKKRKESGNIDSKTPVNEMHKNITGLSRDEIITNRLEEILNSDDLAEQDAVLQKIENEFGEDKLVLLAKGTLFSIRNDYEKAELIYTKLINEYPDFADGHHSYAAYLLHSGKSPELAKQEVLKAIAIDDSNAEYFLNLAKVFAYHFHDYESAALHYKKAIQIDRSQKDAELEEELNESGLKIIAQFNSLTCRKTKDLGHYVAVWGELADSDMIVRRNSIELTAVLGNLVISGITKIEYLDKETNPKCYFNYIKIDFNYFEKKPALWNDDLSILVFKVSVWGGKPTKQIYDRLMELVDNGELKLNQY
jgi:tetratricopeptide (TPR) repeat protein